MSYSVPPRSNTPSLAELWAKEAAERKEAEDQMVEHARADAKAVWALAEHMMPSDFQEMAVRLQMTATLSELWRNAFIAGWRAALKSCA